MVSLGSLLLPITDGMEKSDCWLSGSPFLFPLPTANLRKSTWYQDNCQPCLVSPALAVSSPPRLWLIPSRPQAWPDSNREESASFGNGMGWSNTPRGGTRDPEPQGSSKIQPPQVWASVPSQVGSSPWAGLFPSAVVPHSPWAGKSQSLHTVHKPNPGSPRHTLRRPLISRCLSASRQDSTSSPHVAPPVMEPAQAGISTWGLT